MPVFKKSAQESQQGAAAALPDPDVLMRQIDKAIAAAENLRANRQLAAECLKTSTSAAADKDLQAAEDAFRAALAQRDPLKAIPLLQDAASKCPPDRISALVKIHKLISVAMEKLNNKA